MVRGARTDTEEMVTIAWRRTGGAKGLSNGAPVAVLTVSRRLAASLGWHAEVKRVVAEVDRGTWRLRLRPAGAQDVHGRGLHYRTGTRFVTVPLAWVRSEQRPAEPIPHQVEAQAVILELPEWARERAHAAAPVPRVAERATTQARAQTPDGTQTVAPAHAAAATAAPAPASATAAAHDARARAEALVRELWPRTEVSVPEIARRLEPILGRSVSKTHPYDIARRLGLPTVRSAPPEAAAVATQGIAAPVRSDANDTAPCAPEPAPAPRPAATLKPASSLDARRAEAFADFDAGKTVRQVHEETGESLSDLANWHAQWRRERQQAMAREEAA